MWVRYLLLCGIVLGWAPCSFAGTLTLSWMDAADNEAGFHIERRLAGEPSFIPLAEVGVNVQQYVDTTVPPNVEATYRVRAHNQCCSPQPCTPTLCVSAWSNESSGTFALLPVENMPPLTVTSVEIPPLPVAGLQLYFAFDEGTGTTPQDGSGQGHHGQFLGMPIWESMGRVNGALQFDGTTAAVDVGEMVITGGAVTLAAWAFSDNFANCPGMSDCRILSRANGSGEQDHDIMLSTITSGGQVVPRFRLRTNGVTSTLIASTGALLSQVWHHLAATYDGATMRLYVDGTEVGAMPKTGTLTMTAGRPLWIGDNPLTGGRAWDGMLDEVRLYDRALTPAEIGQLVAQ